MYGARSFLLLLFVCLFFSCAQVRPIQGGPKDTLAPLLISSQPPHESTNFQGKQIQLQFDEWVKTKNAREELLIAPYEENRRFNLSTTKDEALVEFDSALRPNTTYNLNFREGIVDITEGNPASVNISFSTGDYIDSCSIRGRAFHFLTHQPLKEANILLKYHHDTTTIYTGSPAYVTETDEEGRFILRNLPDTIFQLYALKESNRNLIYDRNSELVTRYDTLINFKQQCTQKGIQLFASSYDTIAPRIKKIDTTGPIAELTFSEHIFDFQSLNLKTTQKLFYIDTLQAKKWRLYPRTTHFEDSTDWMVQFKDSAGNTAMDTLRLYLPDTLQADTNRQNLVQSKTIKYQWRQTLRIPFKAPLLKYLPKTLPIIQDSIVKARITPQQQNLNPNQTQLIIRFQNKYPLREGEPYQLALPDSMFYSYQKAYHPADTLLLQPLDESQYGLISGKVLNPPKNHIVQLLNKKYEVQRQSYETHFSFEFLPPGEYTLRLVKDRNQNKRWDQGSFLEYRKPEPIKLLGEFLKVKANWELTGITIEGDFSTRPASE